MLLTSVGWANSYYQSEESYVDGWGVGWKPIRHTTRFGEGLYTEICAHPLEADEAIDRYQAPDPRRPELYRDAERLVAEWSKEYWIVGVTVTTIFETAWALRGFRPTDDGSSYQSRLGGAILGHSLPVPPIRCKETRWAMGRYDLDRR